MARSESKTLIGRLAHLPGLDLVRDYNNFEDLVVEAFKEKTADHNFVKY